MAWIYLVIAGLLEIAWAVSLKRTEGFTKLGPSLFTLAAMVASFYLLSLALRTLPTGTGYAVWVGIGAAGTALFGIFFLKEPATAFRLISVGLILLGVVGLRLAEPG
jgi:quaternary ammonium compound-resistance protein SugE